uniref:Atypical chemokine receptor 4a n=1 Tax=Eptatretus burgeri TaxID=7764 RepID=A0A8C4R3A2_EPTBU
MLSNFFSSISKAPQTTAKWPGAPCTQDAMTFSRTFLPIVYSFVFVLGMVGNGMVILVLICRWRRKDITGIYVFCLALSDILLALTLPLWAYNAANTWVFGNFLCKLTSMIYSINFYAGVLLLACLSADRFFAVCAIHSQQLHRPHIAIVNCTLVWVIAFLLSIFDLVMITVIEYTDENTTTWKCKPIFPAGNEENWQIGLAILKSVATFFVPFTIMVFCYAAIIVKLNRVPNFKQHKTIRTIIAVICVFFICWLPYNVVILVEANILFQRNHSCTSQKDIQYALQFTEAIAYIHCCLNPVLYAFIGIRFPQLKHMGRRLRELLRQQLDSTNSSQQRNVPFCLNLSTF